MLPLQSLLNPINDTPSSLLGLRSPAEDSDSENVRQQLDLASVQKVLDLAVVYFGNSGTSQRVLSSQHSNPRLHPSNPGPPRQSSPSETTWVQYNVEINRQTTLERVIFHPADSLVEYPETSTNSKIGHLFTLDLLQWVNPVHNFAYSLGGSHGMSPKDKPVKVSLLVDDSGEMVPCRVSHSTCEINRQFNLFYLNSFYLGQGCKICPFVDHTLATTPHCTATRDELQLSISHTRKLLHTPTDLSQLLLLKTLSLWSSLCKFGCGAPPHEETFYSGSELRDWERWNAQMEKARRGHQAKATCMGRLLFKYDYQGKPYVW